MNELGIEPSRTLMIGDTTHDLQLSTASIGVSYGAHHRDSCSGFETRMVAHSTAELSDWVQRHG